MKWSKAIAQIEQLLNEGKEVEIEYHRKWARNDYYFRTAIVESVGTYWWFGETLKCIHISADTLDEGTYIIDSVTNLSGDYTGSHHVGDIVDHRGHECRVTRVWEVDGKNGISILPTGNYGFEIDIFEEQL